MVIYFLAIIPLIGMLLANGGMLTNPTAWGAFFIIIDAIVIPVSI